VRLSLWSVKICFQVWRWPGLQGLIAVGVWY
jgi:hypothetical protein